MYSSLPPSLPPHVPVVSVVGPNPDRADEYTEADRRGVVEQQSIDGQAGDRADYQHRLEMIRAKRSTSNIHTNSQSDIHRDAAGIPYQQQPLPALAQPPQHIQVIQLVDMPVRIHASPTASSTSASDGQQQQSASTSSTPPASSQPVAVTSSGAVPPKLASTGGGSGMSRASSLHLDQLDDEQIRALLDPKREDVAWKDMASWPEDKLDALVAAVRPVHLPELLRQSMAVNELQPARMLEWRDLTYVNKLAQPLLKNVTGYLAPGQMVGVFAGPDAGGTPLLNVLGQRKVTGLVNGDILYDHRRPDETFNKTVGYVMKDDPHLATLTV